MNFFRKYIVVFVIACPCILASAQCNRQTDVTSSIATGTEQGGLPSKEEQALQVLKETRAIAVAQKDVVALQTAEAARERSNRKELRAASVAQAAEAARERSNRKELRAAAVAQVADAVIARSNRKELRAAAVAQVADAVIARSNRLQAAAATTLKARWRGHKAEKEFETAKNAATTLQAFARKNRANKEVRAADHRKFQEQVLEIQAIQDFIARFGKLEIVRRSEWNIGEIENNNESSEAQLENRITKIKQAVSNLFKSEKLISEIVSKENISKLFHKLGNMEDREGFAIKEIQDVMILLGNSIEGEILKNDQDTQHLIHDALGMLEEQYKASQDICDSIPDIISVPSDSTQETPTGENPQQPPTPLRSNTHGNNRQGLEYDDHTATTYLETPSASLETTSRSFE